VHLIRQLSTAPGNPKRHFMAILLRY